jgi:Tol biopolymer transport system component/serine/threonine protein kinase
MTPEQHRRIGALYHAALELAPEARPGFLSAACGGDEYLRREVESLLWASEQADGQADGFIPAEVAGVAALMAEQRQNPSLASSLASSLIGRSVSHYEVLSLLGAGGMGEVYLAHDTRLGRKVALKLLPPAFTRDEERLRRFEREARSVSALNHPNILTIYEVGMAGDTHFIATEFIDGQTLRERLRDGRLALGESLEIAMQIASALSAAHEAGIVHRDIKPENVMTRRDGIVKVLDFGLSKLAEWQISENTEGATLQKVTTDLGRVLGTPQYMSPEQGRGQKVDTRTDIFSLGVVLYEMIAGCPPFAGVNAMDMIGAILNQEPAPLKLLVPEATPELQRIVTKALRKEREKRYQLSQELLLDLKELKEELLFAAKLRSVGAADSVNQELAAPSVPTAEWRAETAAVTPAITKSSAEVILTEIKRHKLGLTLALVVVIAGAGWWLSSSVTRPQPHAGSGSPVAQIVPFTSFKGDERSPSFSPDGNQIAYAWDGEAGNNYDIYVKQIGTEALARLTTDSAADLFPRWSPDGRHIAFIRQTAEGGGLYLMSSLGGAERRIATLSPTQTTHSFSGFSSPLSWSPDGEWLAVADRSSPQEPSSIFLVARESGEKRRLTAPPLEESAGDTQPAIAPDGKSVAFIRLSRGDLADLYLVPVAGGEARRLTFESGAMVSPTWTPEGLDILFLNSAGGSLWRMPAAGGTPERVDAAGQGLTDLAISRQGNRLAWSQGIFDSNIWQVELSGAAIPTGRKQSAQALISSTRTEVSPQFSPDGKRIVFASNRSGSAEIWVCDSTGERPVQLTAFNRSTTGSPRWSPDGRQIVFDARAESSADIYVIAAEGGKPRRLTADISEEVVPSWSHDGQWIYFSSNRSGNPQIWKMPASGGQAVQVTRQGGVDNQESPDGQFLYYTKRRNAPGIWRMPTAGGAETLVLEAHRAGYWRQWQVVAHGIYFVTAETLDRPLIEFFGFATGKITTVFAPEKRLPGTYSALSVSSDGRRLIWTQADQTSSDIMLMENFR